MTAPIDTLAPELRDRVRYSDDAIVLLEGRWQDCIAGLPMVDAVISDPPYSERTHEGMQVIAADSMSRGPVAYASWSPSDVDEAIDAWHDKCAGWMAVLNDHVLGPAIEAAYKLNERYVFPPLPCVELGKQPRHTGDGPASWSTFLYTARPRRRPFSVWGSLDGAYVQRGNEIRPLKGGKPVWLMRAIVRDYSHVGDLVLDPCAGAGTTAIASRDLGRRCILIEADPGTCEMARERIAKHAQQQVMFRPDGLDHAEQEGLPL